MADGKQVRIPLWFRLALASLSLFLLLLLEGVAQAAAEYSAGWSRASAFSPSDTETPTPVLTDTLTGTNSPTETPTLANTPTSIPTFTPTPTSTITATPCGGQANYEFTTETDSMEPGLADTGNHCDDCTTTITFPFAYSLYGQPYTSANASSNGSLQFASNATDWSYSCLPNQSLNSAILAYWDDLRTDSGLPGCVAYSSGCGIFTTVEGSEPYRTLDIEWEAVYYDNSAQPANFEVKLYEWQNRFDIVYGRVDQAGGSATVGVQSGAGPQYTQVECNVGGLTQGMSVRFREPACGTNTPVPTPTGCVTFCRPILHGHVTWQGLPQPSILNTLVTGTVTFCDNGTQLRFAVNSDQNDNFILNPGLLNGTYNWRLKGGRHLSSAGALTIYGDSNVDFGVQKTGDANADNLDNVNEFISLKHVFGQSGNFATDFNYDGMVNATDFIWMKLNFGQAGAPFSCPGGP